MLKFNLVTSETEVGRNIKTYTYPIDIKGRIFYFYPKECSHFGIISIGENELVHLFISKDSEDVARKVNLKNIEKQIILYPNANKFLVDLDNELVVFNITESYELTTFYTQPLSKGKNPVLNYSYVGKTYSDPQLGIMPITNGLAHLAAFMGKSSRLTGETFYDFGCRLAFYLSSSSFGNGLNGINVNEHLRYADYTIGRGRRKIDPECQVKLKKLVAKKSAPTQNASNAIIEYDKYILSHILSKGIPNTPLKEDVEIDIDLSEFGVLKMWVQKGQLATLVSEEFGTWDNGTQLKEMLALDNNQKLRVEIEDKSSFYIL